MQFGILGPLAVTTDGGEPVVVPGAKVRVLLAALLTNRGQVVSADRLIDDLWGRRAPANPLGALQVRISQLRKALNDAEPGARELVESHSPGYLLRAPAVDADRFAELAAATDADRLTAALALWRGDAYADVADLEFVRAEADRLTEQRLAVHERLADARLARGEHDLVAAELGELVAKHPLREHLRLLHLRALYAAGRRTEALDSYTELRKRLAGSCCGRCRCWPYRMTSGTWTRSGGRPRPGSSPPGPPHSSAVSGSTNAPRPRSRSSAAVSTGCRWPWNWPPPGCGRWA